MKHLDIATKRLIFTRFLKGVALFAFSVILLMHVIHVVTVYVQVDGLNDAAKEIELGYFPTFSNGLGVARVFAIDSIRSLSLVLLFAGSAVAAFMVRLGPPDKQTSLHD